MVTVCTDTPEQIRKGRGKHGARAVMLSDPDLEIANRYNLRNEGNLAPGRSRAMPEIRALPIPTTILVDGGGTVRWIDQAEDYQIRSHPERVLRAIEEGLA
jgi:peroxiredoxin